MLVGCLLFGLNRITQEPLAMFNLSRAVLHLFVEKIEVFSWLSLAFRIHAFDCE
jgi:hypothetical protein